MASQPDSGQRIIGECLLISCLTGKASRMLGESCWVNLEALPKDSTWVLKSEHGKLFIKRRKSGILFVNLPIG